MRKSSAILVALSVICLVLVSCNAGSANAKSVDVGHWSYRIHNDQPGTPFRSFSVLHASGAGAGILHETGRPDWPFTGATISFYRFGRVRITLLARSGFRGLVGTWTGDYGPQISINMHQGLGARHTIGVLIARIQVSGRINGAYPHRDSTLVRLDGGGYVGRNEQIAYSVHFGPRSR